jgi:phosphate transport system substrate-binding protein
MKIRTIRTIFLFVIVGINLTAISVFAEQLIIPGTGASEVIMQELANAFHAENPEHEIVIPPSVGSGGGIKLVGTDKNILGRIARPIKDDELSYGLESLPFAKDMVLFVVGEKVGIKNLSAQQLAEVFSGKIENWQEVGGNDTRVRLLIREPGDSSLLIIRQKLSTFKNITFSERAKVLFHDYEMVKALNKYTTVIGWITNSSMREINSSRTAIAINNIAPTQENAYDGQYTLTGEYALVYKMNNLDGLARSFVDFIFSKKGSKILIDNGLIPVKQLQY